jgi:hypothetical protein
MKRRRLIVVVTALALITAGGWWALLLWQQYRVEQQLVGTWRFYEPETGAWTQTLFIRPDGQFVCDDTDPQAMRSSPRPWSVRGREFVTDEEPSRLYRVLRPLVAQFGGAVAAEHSMPFEVTADTLVFIWPNDLRRVWSRAPAD